MLHRFHGRLASERAVLSIATSKAFGLAAIVEPVETRSYEVLSGYSGNLVTGRYAGPYAFTDTNVSTGGGCNGCS